MLCGGGAAADDALSRNPPLPILRARSQSTPFRGFAGSICGASLPGVRVGDDEVSERR